MPTKERLLKANDSLAVIVRLLVSVYRRSYKSRVHRVITLNADDCLDRAVQLLQEKSERVLQPILTPLDHHPDETQDANPIELYHLHDYVPLRTENAKPAGIYKYDDMLIFTDGQYWQPSSSIFSFTNLIMGGALHDSYCIFIGLSMTDINLLRCLALRCLEMEQSWKHQSRYGVDKLRRKITLDDALTQHFWVRPASLDPGGFLSDFLIHRGVQPVNIKSWNDGSFRRLLDQCFTRQTIG